MLGIILGLLYQINGALFTISQKSITNLISSRGALSTHLLFIPIGIIAIFLSYIYDSSAVSNDLLKYSILTISFGLVVAFNIYLGFSLLKHINTSSFFKYKAGNTMLLALLSDYLFFGIIPTYLTIFIGVLFLFSGKLLNKAKEKNAKTKTVLKLFLMSVGVITSMSLLKEIVMISNNDFLSLFIVQTVTQVIIGIFGIKYFKEVLANKTLLKHGMIYSCLILSLIIIEFFTFKVLSVFIIIALSNIKFIIYLGFDLFKRELDINRNMIIGSLIGFFGIGLLVWSKI